MGRFKLHIDGQYHDGEGNVKLKVEMAGTMGDISEALNSMMHQNESFAEIMMEATKEFITESVIDDMTEAINNVRPSGPSDN